MKFSTLTIDQICVSPLNARINREDANRTAALESSIERVGLIFPLIVHPMPANEDGTPPEAPYGALAGGRRCRAIRKLVDAGRLPADWPIAVSIRDLDKADIIELSFIENYQRVDLRPYENHAAIAAAFEAGHTVEEIAANTDQTEKWVRQQLRLGTLHPEIFAAYADEKLAAAEAIAFAATADQELQYGAWRYWRNLPDWQRRAELVLRFYKIGDREEMRLLRFVGEADYRQAGGRFELNLFAEGADERGRIVDLPLLRSLVDQKLDQVRASVRHRARRPDLRFGAEPPLHANTTDHALSFKPAEARDEDGPWLVLPGDDVFATLTIGDDGEVELHWWWSSRQAKASAEKKGRALARSRMPSTPVPVANFGQRAAGAPPSRLPEGAEAFKTNDNFDLARAARAAVREQYGLSADGLHAMRSLRREMLRAMLVMDASDGGAMGRDYLVWAQLRQELVDEGATDVGARGLGGTWFGSDDSEPADFVRPFLRDSGAGQIVAKALAELSAQPFLQLTEPTEAFDAFVAAEPRVKNLAAAVLAGLALLRSANAPGWLQPMHDHLAEQLEFDDAGLRLRGLWRPDAAFLGLFPKPERLDLARPFADEATMLRLAKAKDEELTRGVVDVLTCEGRSFRARLTDQALRWIHPLMSFHGKGRTLAQVLAEQAPIQEPAE